MSKKPATVREILELADIRASEKRARESKRARDIERDEYPFSPSDRDWFRKPLRALAVIASLAFASHAHAAPHGDSKAVASAKSELATAKAHLKAARATDKAHAKASKRESKRVKLQRELAKMEAEDLTAAIAPSRDARHHDPGLTIGCGTCTDNHDGSCTCEGR